MSKSRSSSNDLSQMLSKNNRRKKDASTSGSISIASSAESEGLHETHHGARSTLGGAMEKLKSRVETFEDVNANESNGLGKLLSKGMSSKRRQKKQEREEERRASEEAARGRSVADRGTLENEFAESSPGGSSARERDVETCSVVTYDSDVEFAHATKPPLSTHPSHIGYLTTSSPLVHATTLSDTSKLTLDSQLDGNHTTEIWSSPKANTLAASDREPDLSSGNLRAPNDGSQRRSPSPVGRLKEVLTPRRGASPRTSPERKAGGGGPASTGKEKHSGPKEKPSSAENRRGSVASRIGSIFPDRNTSQTTLNSTTSSPERPRTGKTIAIDTNVVPQTPPQGDRPAPIIVNTPPTPTEPGISRFPNQQDPNPSVTVSEPNPNVVTSPSGNMISHRRLRSGSGSTLGPSKLSNITSAPLTPTPENGSPGQGGFFSSVFSAAQNAANTLSSSIGNTTNAPNQTRSRSGTHDLKEVESPVVESLGEKSDSESQTEQKEPAVKTLGMGDLSLSQLGIPESNSNANTPTASKFTESHETRGRSESMMSEEAYANRVGGAGQGVQGDGLDGIITAQADDVQSLPKPRSIQETTLPGEQTPPNGSLFEGKSGIHRSGSIRSAMGKRRKRGSSAATGHSAIGAAIVAANASLARPSAVGPDGTPKITGFAVASKKRNRDFHNLFRSVPDDDYLIEDYSCALQREILAHGRLYVSEGHLCFSSNIFGWVTTLVMSFDEIVSVEKRSTALLFKNGLMISTLHAKNIFASFTSRDSTYDLIVGIWKLGHPSLRSSLNGVRIEETGGGDKTEKDDGSGANGSQSSDSESESDDGDEVYDEDEEEEDGMSFTQAEGSVAGSDIGEKVVSRKASAAVVTNGAATEKPREGTAPPAVVDYPGPTTHAPTDCIDRDTHYDRIIADELVPAPLGKVYSMMFGPASVTWIRNWLTEDQKCLELTMDEQTKPLGLDNKTRNYSYIKPLNGAIGPKQTKCISTETLDSLDYEKAISVTISTQTPDVPSGNVFSTKTKYCLSWGEGNSTRIQMNCAIEWTGKSWLKGPIEKGANDGQVKYAKDIVASLKATLSSRRGTTTPVAGGKGKKKGRKGRENKGESGSTTVGVRTSKPASDDWGFAEPLHGILGPFVDILKPLFSGNIMYGLLLGVLVASWFGFGFTGRNSASKDMAFFKTPERIAAYEAIWKREESELWDWLEERVSMDRIHENKKRPIRAKDVEERLRDEKMDARAVEDAIRVTEEKLKVLKGVVEKKRGHGHDTAETAAASSAVPETGESV
ncbi:GRAM domain-containing protein [Phlyctema vagabunda]|uniref:GRAM domain-containing protein n=1 Tax=Phlyctema vagabunda TaxID=108571 RepID=A0ABR4P9Q1_9HELO